MNCGEILVDDLRSFSEGVDRLVSVEVTGRGVAEQLQTAARALAGAPLAMGAASLLKGALAERGCAVFIATGFPIHPYYLPEQDGIVGAASLARALVLAYGAHPILVVNPADEEAASRALVAASLYSRSVEAALDLPATAAVVPFPVDSEHASKVAADLCDRAHPAAMVAIERPGANENGDYHSGGGLRLTDHCGKVEALLPLLKAAKIPTIAIGDGGNELGCSGIRDAVIEKVPGAARCSCPCQGSLVPVAEIDWLVIASVSNWGSYGIEACLAALERMPELLHTPETDRRIHEACAAAMANNGAPNLLEPGSDAIPLHVHGAILEILDWMVRAAALDAGRYYRRPRYPWLDQVR